MSVTQLPRSQRQTDMEWLERTIRQSIRRNQIRKGWFRTWYAGLVIVLLVAGAALWEAARLYFIGGAP